MVEVNDRGDVRLLFLFVKKTKVEKLMQVFV